MVHTGGWETLGDMGYCDSDGYLYITDRQSDMVCPAGASRTGSTRQRLLGFVVYYLLRQYISRRDRKIRPENCRYFPAMATIWQRPAIES